MEYRRHGLVSGCASPIGERLGVPLDANQGHEGVGSWGLCMSADPVYCSCQFQEIVGVVNI